MKKFFKRLFYVLIIVFVLIQLYPRPAKNISTEISTNDINNKYPIPPEVASILKTSCTDCHSNNTEYPWYSQIQPIAWWMGDHVKDGKRKFNFSEFLGYTIARQNHKLEEVEETITSAEMPLKSYLITHQNAKLTAAEKATLINWSKAVRDSLRQNYPADSLIMPKKKK